MKNLVRSCVQRLRQYVNNGHIDVVSNEARMIAAGWDQYAGNWNRDIVQEVQGHRVRYLGDEWTAMGWGQNTYGLNERQAVNFNEYITEHLLNPYLPSSSVQGLEIGPGGGRLTALLTKITEILHVADSSNAMLQHLRKRFADVSTLRFYLTDGITLPALQRNSLDYVIAFDVFVHFEPRLVYSYLRQIAELLRPGGVGIIHYSSVITPLGWQRFEQGFKNSLNKRTYHAFGVMCPQLMAKFLESLELNILSTDVGVIPRDAIAVFRKPSDNRDVLATM